MGEYRTARIDVIRMSDENLGVTAYVSKINLGSEGSESSEAIARTPGFNLINCSSYVDRVNQLCREAAAGVKAGKNRETVENRLKAEVENLSLEGGN